MTPWRLPALVAAFALLAACATIPGKPADENRAPPLWQVDQTAVTVSADSLAAFRRACPAILARPDASGLTQASDWQEACADPESDAKSFFARHFTALVMAGGAGLATGYYEPEIPASRAASPGAAPILGPPAEKAPKPLPDRAAIEAGALDGIAPVIAWTTDRIGYYFLQIQGSGVLRFADGARLRVGYAGNNGQPYVAIGRLLRERGLPKADMPAIRHWLQLHPTDGISLMQENPRFIFLAPRPDDGDGPAGALGVPLMAGVNIAADTALLPMGTPVAIVTEIDGRPWQTLAIVADRGSAIKGANRFDIFLGAGTTAERQAGVLAAPLQARILLPNAAARRLLTR